MATKYEHRIYVNKRREFFRKYAGGPGMNDDPIFEGPCRCEHTKEQHGWAGCLQGSCLCVAGWDDE